MVYGEQEGSPQPARPRSLRGRLRNTGARLTKKKNRPFLAILAIGAVALLIAVLGTPIVAQLQAFAAPEDEGAEEDVSRGVSHRDLKNLLVALQNSLNAFRRSVNMDLGRLEASVLDALSREHRNLAMAIRGDISDLKAELLNVKGELMIQIGMLQTTLDDIKASVMPAIRALNSRLNSIDMTLGAIDTKLGLIQGTLNDVAGAVDTIGQQVMNIQNAVNGIASAVARVENSLGEIRQSLSDIDGKLDGIKARLDETLVIRHIGSYGAAIQGMGKVFSIIVSCTGNFLVKSVYADVSATSGSAIDVFWDQVRAKGDFAGTGIIHWQLGSTFFDPTIGVESTLPVQLLSKMNVNHPIGIPAAGLFVIDGQVQSVGGGFLSVGVVVVTSGTSVCSTVVNV